MKPFILVAIVSIYFSSAAAAAPRDRTGKKNVRTNTTIVVNSVPIGINFSDDQSRCQIEANYMAANNIKGHVWGTIGRFEGVGYGSSPHCVTCTPSYNMNLTGDASAQGRNGMWYRVRSWR